MIRAIDPTTTREPAERRARGGRYGSEPFGVLDIGTGKVSCYIVRAAGARGHRLLGRGFQFASGLDAGEIIDPGTAEISIQAVLAEAERQIDDTVDRVVAVFGGGNLRSARLRVQRTLDGAAVSAETIRRCLETARTELAGDDTVVLHAIPIEASIDGGRTLRDPRGLFGHKVEILVHAVIADAHPIRTLLDCLYRCHVEVREIVAAPVASALSVLSADELDLGCLVIDIGAAVTQIAHCAGGQVVHVDQVLGGGQAITHELACGLHTSVREAERLKNLYGSVQWRTCDDNVRISVPLIGDFVEAPTGEIPRTKLTGIIRQCVQELFNAVITCLNERGDIVRARPPRSLVLTGGSAQIEGLVEYAEEVFGLPARLGRPTTFGSSLVDEADSSFAATAGAVRLLEDDGMALFWSDGVERPRLLGGYMRLKEWFRQNF